MNRMSRNKTKNHYGFINTLELLKSYGENWREFQKWVDGGLEEEEEEEGQVEAWHQQTAE